MRVTTRSLLLERSGKGLDLGTLRSFTKSAGVQMSSLEGETRVAAPHDKLGTVALTVYLRSGFYSDAGSMWSAGGRHLPRHWWLDALARQAAKLAGNQRVD